MNYTWDDNKQALNLVNHKIHFAITEQFEWETALIEPDQLEPDQRRNYGEPRFCA